MEPIAAWSEERVTKWLQGLDAPTDQYQVSEWHLSGLDLLQLTSQDLEVLGVQKIGHQELILEAVEKLCSLTYGMGGETLRGLTEKLRVVAHSLPMAIQGGWRHNSYDGRSATKLPVGVLKNVIELITSARGLFCLLTFRLMCNFATPLLKSCRFTLQQDSTVYEKEKDIISVCRQLVEVCDEILNSSSDALLTHTAQLESVSLVPATPSDQLGIEITSTSSSNHYVTGTAAEPSSDAYLQVLSGDEVIQVNDQIVVGWSRAKLIEKLRENPSGVTLIIKRIPGSLSDEEEPEDKEENQRHSIFERVAASLKINIFKGFNGECTHLFCCICGGFPGMSTALSRRRVSCRDLAHPDCDGWLWKKRKESSVFITQKWQRFWFVLQGPNLYWYNTQQDEKAEGLLNISSYSLEGGGEHKRKHVFQMTHQKFQNFFFSVDSATDLNGGTVDEMGMMFNNLKEGGVSLIGHEQPFTQDHFRKSFIRRNKNPVINEKVHTLRALQNSRDIAPAEGGEDVAPAEGGEDVAPVRDTPAEDVALETVATETAAAETEGAYRLSLSDGEQLVDAEPSDVLLEIPQETQSPESSPVLELSLGSLSDSINNQLRKNAESRDAGDHYFYI
uniref:Connector enhancer of kinase suppressor of Ras 1 n=1 Tax=Poecilia latipinna TaxID=48699 RepID=A0A3B3VDL7_9TELE